MKINCQSRLCHSRVLALQWCCSFHFQLITFEHHRESSLCEPHTPLTYLNFLLIHIRTHSLIHDVDRTTYIYICVICHCLCFDAKICIV